MNTMYFECCAIDEIVVRARASTEGANRSLKYISGNVFLGVVAKKYNEFGDDCFEIFHSGKVVFGDGHLSQNGHRSLVNPLTWFYNKGEKIKQNEKLIHNNISIFEGKQDESNQKKQVRDIFFTPDGNCPEVLDSFSLKSAHDSTRRKSENGKMYGYHALPAGTTWIFYIKGEQRHLQKIKTFVEGQHSIGKSKSSQYGRVTIKHLPNYECKWQQSAASNNLLFIYADSLLSFVNSYGEPTFIPQASDLGIEGKIRWDLSQVRTFTYAPYNSMRRSRDADRVCLAKGSVLVVEVAKNFDCAAYRSKVQGGIGIYRNEGMGQILINPSFLLGETPQFTAPLTQKQQQIFIPTVVQQHESDAILESWLEEHSENDQLNTQISQLVENLIRSDVWQDDSGEEVTSSQWSGIRSIAQKMEDYDKLQNALFRKSEVKEECGFLMRGQNENLWLKNERREELKKFVQKVYDEQNNSEKKYLVVQTFLVELCKEMAKKVKRGA